MQLLSGAHPDTKGVVTGKWQEIFPLRYVGCSIVDDSLFFVVFACMSCGVLGVVLGVVPRNGTRGREGPKVFWVLRFEHHLVCSYTYTRTIKVSTCSEPSFPTKPDGLTQKGLKIKLD
jgi:hypothetical protein